MDGNDMTRKRNHRSKASQPPIAGCCRSYDLGGCCAGPGGFQSIVPFILEKHKLAEEDVDCIMMGWKPFWRTNV